MITGSKGTFAIRWQQTEIDGVGCPQLSALRNGATWRWTGGAIRVDGADPPPEDRGDAFIRRRRASYKLKRLLGQEIRVNIPDHPLDDDGPVSDSDAVLTDGRTTYPVTFIETDAPEDRLVMFPDRIPARDTDLWVMNTPGDTAPVCKGSDVGKDVICFAEGTRIATPQGFCPVERLFEGDWIVTQDNGPQQVMWHGVRRMSGARFYAMPEARPIRIRAGALGADRPDGDLLVSPRHRILVRGELPRSLFNTDEVLVRADQLVNGRSITVDYSLTETAYHHLMLDAHQVVFANGAASESFHPANIPLYALENGQCARLLELCPELAHDCDSYGEHVRRRLTMPEAAILNHALNYRR
ncbi:MAG: Hint domain-containing protein [Pseudomonadota bacterium]